MAINLIPEPTAGAPLGVADYNYQNALQQALHGMGSHNDILTEWDTTTEPEIAVGARLVHDGGLYECQLADEAIAGAPADGYVYIKLTETLGVITAEFVTSDAGYTFDPIKGGWYHADGTQLLPYVLLKYDSTYWKKTKLLPHQFGESADLATAAQVYPFAAMKTLVQDDLLGALPLPADLTYFPFSNQNLEDSAGNAPLFRSGGLWLDHNNANAKHTNRGIFYFNAEFVAYTYAFGNEQVIAVRIKPNFAYTVATNVTILNANNFSGVDNDSFTFRYNQGDDKWFFRIMDDETHKIVILSDQYLDNPTLQIWTDFYIKYSKVNNNMEVWINGIQMDGIAHGTKTVTGGAAAITGLNMTKTNCTIGASNILTTGYANYSDTNFYISDLGLDAHYVDTYYDNYDGGTVLPYVIDVTKMLSGIGQNWQILQSGNAGFNQLSVNSIDNGAGQWKMKKIPIGAWDMSAATGSTSVSVYTGILSTKIIFYSTIIFSDAGTAYFLLNFSNAADPTLIAGGVAGALSTIINLYRRTGGYFDGASFNDATVNRGYIYAFYAV
jgi:hypothetical protein